MKKTTIALAFAVAVAQIGAASAEDVPDWKKRITPDATLFVVVEGVNGDTLYLRFVNMAKSRQHDGAIIFAGDRAVATLVPLLPNGTRRAACVTEISGNQGQGMGRIADRIMSAPSPDCLAYLQDYEGATGLPLGEIRVGAPARLMLNGDLYFSK